MHFWGILSTSHWKRRSLGVYSLGCKKDFKTERIMEYRMYSTSKYMQYNFFFQCKKLAFLKKASSSVLVINLSESDRLDRELASLLLNSKSEFFPLEKSFQKATALEYIGKKRKVRSINVAAERSNLSDRIQSQARVCMRRHKYMLRRVVSCIHRIIALHSLHNG